MLATSFQPTDWDWGYVIRAHYATRMHDLCLRNATHSTDISATGTYPQSPIFEASFKPAFLLVTDANKGLIHSSFSSNPNWPYDWSAFNLQCFCRWCSVPFSSTDGSITHGTTVTTVPMIPTNKHRMWAKILGRWLRLATLNYTFIKTLDTKHP